MAEEKSHHVLVLKILNSDNPKFCNLQCGLRKTSSGDHPNWCLLYGDLETLPHGIGIIRHERCMLCPTLDIEPQTVKNIKEIKEEILVFADRLEDLGALSLAKTFRSLLKDITVEEK